MCRAYSFGINFIHSPMKVFLRLSLFHNDVFVVDQEDGIGIVDLKGIVETLDSGSILSECPDQSSLCDNFIRSDEIFFFIIIILAFFSIATSLTLVKKTMKKSQHRYIKRRVKIDGDKKKNFDFSRRNKSARENLAIFFFMLLTVRANLDKLEEPRRAQARHNRDFNFSKCLSYRWFIRK